MWGATEMWATFDTDKLISIHAPRVGRDAVLRGTDLRDEYFNPRAPCGARQLYFQ